MMIIGVAVALLALLLGSLSFLFLLIFYSSSAMKGGPEGLPHGSMGWPLIGETLSYLKPHKSNSMGTFLQERCSKHGRVFKSHLFGNPTIVSCDLELNTYVLQNEDRLFQTYYPKPVKEILGKLSILLVTNDLHKKLRNVAVNFAGASRFSTGFTDYLDRLSVSVMNSWKHRQQVHFFSEAKEFTMQIMLKHMLNVEPPEPVALEIFKDFLTFMKGFVSVPINIPGTSFSKAIKARARISGSIRQIIRERGIKSQEGGPAGAEGGDFLDEILRKGILNEEEQVSVVLDILLAGYETTSGLMALVVYFLAHSPPTVLKKLREEHQAIRRQKNEGEPLNLKDYKRMEFTSKVISEALRCGNLVKFVHRKALQDVKFKDYHIPAGWQVIPILTAVHLDPSLHPNPSLFDPFRWLDETTSKKVVAFGGGLRLCPGAELGKLETAFFIHHLVINYKWKTKEDEYPISYPYLEFHRQMLLEIEPIAFTAN